MPKNITVTREQLEAALPAAPSGHFWKLKRSEGSLYPLNVVLHRKRWIGSTYVFAQRAEPTISSVSKKARNIIEWVNNKPKREAEEAQQKRQLSKLTGNYGLKRGR